MELRPRLLLRPFGPEGEDGLFRFFNEPRVRHYLCDDLPVSREMVQEHMPSARGSSASEALACSVSSWRKSPGRSSASPGSGASMMVLRLATTAKRPSFLPRPLWEGGLDNHVLQGDCAACPTAWRSARVAPVRGPPRILRSSPYHSTGLPSYFPRTKIADIFLSPSMF